MGTASVPQVDPRKHDVARRCGEIIMNAVRQDLKPRDIVTRASFENAIAAVASSGGSTNAVLHLLAMASEAGVPLEIDDFQAVSERTPLLVDLKPAGKFVAVDVDKAGGIPVIAQRLMEGGLCGWVGPHGDRAYALRRKQRMRKRDAGSGSDPRR